MFPTAARFAFRGETGMAFDRSMSVPPGRMELSLATTGITRKDPLSCALFASVS